MEQPTAQVQTILAFLNGTGELNVRNIAQTQPEFLARCIAYVLREKYHRENLCEALVSLIKYAPPTYRGIAWSLIQQVPLSHLLYLPRVIRRGKVAKRRIHHETPRSLRHAVACKIATADRMDLARAYFLAPDLFRSLVTFFPLPQTRIKDQEITNEAYRTFYQLSQIGIPDAMSLLGLSVPALFTQLNLPLDRVMGMIQSAEEAAILAQAVSPDSFFEHGRWYQNILGEAEYTRIALQKVAKVKDPIGFLAKRDHLEDTSVLTPQLTAALEQRAEQIFAKMLKDFNLERLALLVDHSGSMQAAVRITQKLYEAFSQMKVNITDLITFATQAAVVTLPQLREISITGGTSIGSAVVLLTDRMQERKIDYPQAILLVSDLGDNTDPRLSKALPLLHDFADPPLIVIHCGQRENLSIDYPHAKLPIDDFHPSLVMDIIKQIAHFTAKVVQEKKKTAILKERKPFEEEIGAIELPERPPETYQSGYLVRLLCPK